MKRYFIVSPLYEHDTLWKVCSTLSKRSFLEAYSIDNYKEERDFDNEGDATYFIKARGHRVSKRNII